MLKENHDTLTELHGPTNFIAEELEFQTNEVRAQPSASDQIRANREIVCRTSFFNCSMKISLLLLSLALLSFSAFTFPETLFQIQLGSMLGKEVGVVVPIFAVIPALLFLSILFRIFDQKYSIGQESITKLSGTVLFLRTRSLQVYLNEIRSIEVTRTLLQRLVHIGDVQICAIGSDNPTTTLEGVRNPEMIKSIIEHRRHKLKSSERSFHRKSMNREVVN